MDFNKAVELYRTLNLQELSKVAAEECLKVHGKNVYLRALIEFTNHCACDCLYCGIRRDNKNLERYRMTEDLIYEAVKLGYARGLRTFMLQGGEDPYFTTEKLCSMVKKVKTITRDNASIALSCGMKSKEEYLELKKAGVNRYLMRFETSDPELHKYLRNGISLEKRLEALQLLKDLDFEVGSGFMVGLPGETEDTIINNVKICHEMQFDMIGIGPFIPHEETPLKDAEQIPIEKAIKATAFLRIAVPTAHIPATTAAGSLDPKGRENMIKAGANILMPNITPVEYKKNYLLYPGKICLDESGFQCVGCLDLRVKSVNRELSFARADAVRLERARETVG